MRLERRANTVGIHVEDHAWMRTARRRPRVEGVGDAARRLHVQRLGNYIGGHRRSVAQPRRYDCQMSERPSRWGDVPPHWRTCVELAWAAYGRGTTPVGAIVVDGQGREVGRGVNARHADPDAQLPLAGSHLAHAELVAVSGLGSHARYPDHTLYSTLEPCLLCVGAAVMA